MAAKVDPRLLAVPVFDGFPYLVTRIAGALHHLILLAADRSERELIALARRQYAANRLGTCLVVSPDRALYFYEGSEAWSDFVPRSTVQISGRLYPPESTLGTADGERFGRLAEHIRRHRISGCLVALPRGRAPTPAEREHLGTESAGGIPNGVTRCGECGGWRGEALLKKADVLVTVHCQCDNHNLCARCLTPLAGERLDAAHLDERIREVLWTPAFAGLDHECPDGRKPPREPVWAKDARVHRLLAPEPSPQSLERLRRRMRLHHGCQVPDQRTALALRIAVRGQEDEAREGLSADLPTFREGLEVPRVVGHEHAADVSRPREEVIVREAPEARILRHCHDIVAAPS
jgi:hypothetical protein